MYFFSVSHFEWQNTVGNLTSFQYNGCAVVDYCVVDQRLLDSVNFFKIGDFTTFSDHCQLTACFSLNHFENNYKLERKSPKGIKWSKNVADAFPVTDSVRFGGKINTKLFVLFFGSK